MDISVRFQITRIAMTSSSWEIEHKLLLDFEYFCLNLCYARMGWSHMLVKDVNSNIICISQLSTHNLKHLIKYTQLSTL